MKEKEFTAQIRRKKEISGTKFYGPRISRIHKIMPKIRPKFLDVYASTVYTVNHNGYHIGLSQNRIRQ
jgi:hypothetical protein